MKASVVIKNGTTEIVLTPENDFELDVIEKTIDKKYTVKKTTVDSDYSYHSHSNHRIVIEIEQHKKNN